MAENLFDFIPQSSAELPEEPSVKGNEFTRSFLESADATSPMRIEASKPVSLRDRLNTSGLPESITYAPDAAADLYRYQDGFDGRYFNPLDTYNYKRFADKETFSSALGKGFDSFGHKFGNTFVDYWKGYGRMAEALVSMDWDKMRPDEATMADLYYQDQIDMNKNFVFELPENEDDIFTKRTMSEFIGNAGFALGTFAGISLEIAADIAATYLSGGAGSVSFGATFAKIAAKEGAEATLKTGYKFADALADIGKIGQDTMKGWTAGAKSVDEIAAMSNTLQKIEKTSAIANMSTNTAKAIVNDIFTGYSKHLLDVTKAKNIFEAGSSFLKATPLVGTSIRSAEKLIAAGKAGANTAEMIGVGLHGMRRVAQELNMSATEASFEAVTTYGDTLDKMIQQYSYNNDGKIPDPAEFERMRTLALEASSSNYNTNLGLLLTTNQIQFGNIFNRFVPANKYMTDIADNIVRVQGSKGAGAFMKKGFLGTYGTLGEIAEKFGKKQAAYQFAKAFGKNFLKFEVTEGIQENLQETSAAGWRNYYMDKMDGATTTIMDAMGEGMSEQFTKQGLKTFLMGAFTGAIVSGPTALVNNALTSTNRAMLMRQYGNDPKTNPILRAEAQQKKDLENLNLMLDNITSKKMTKVFNFAAQLDAAQQQSEAAAKGLRYEFENGKDNALLSAVMAAQRTNTTEMLYRAVSEMGDNMSADEFEKSFGIKLEDTKYATPSEFSKAVARDIKKYSDTMDALRTKMKPVLSDPSKYEKGSKSMLLASLIRSTQEDAIEMLAMNAIKADMSSDRAIKTAEDLRSIPGLSVSSDYALRILTNPKVLGGERGNILSEIAQLEESLKAEGVTAEDKSKIREQLEAKKAEIDLINKWESFWQDIPGAQKAEKLKDELDFDNVAFVGKEIVQDQELEDEEGNPLGTVEKTYNPKDEEVINTFREILNLKNKQAGLNTKVTEQELRDGFEKVLDFIRLDKDARDYMRHVDALMNPENMMYTLQKMLDGRFKYHVVAYASQLNNVLYNDTLSIITELGLTGEADIEDVYKEMIGLLETSENYKNMQVLASDPTITIDNHEYFNKLLEGFMGEVQAKKLEVVKKYDPELYNADVDAGETKSIIDSGVIPTERLVLLADKVARNTALSENEKKLYDVFKEQIDREAANIKATIVDKEEEKVIEEVKTETIEVEAPEVITETPPAVVSTADDSPAEDFGTSDALTQLLGLPQETPFATTGDAQEGFDVVDKAGNTVNSEKIQDEETALQQADSLNQTRMDMEFAISFYGPIDPQDADAYRMMMEGGRLAMERSNKKNGTAFDSLEEFAKTGKGKRALQRARDNVRALKESEATGKPPVRNKNTTSESTTVVVNAPAIQTSLFDTPSSGRAVSLTLASLETLNNKVQEFRQQALQNPENFSKFVEKGNAVTAPVTEASILEKLNNIHSCF